MTGLSVIPSTMPTVDTMSERLMSIPFIRASGMEALSVRAGQAVTRVVARPAFRSPGGDHVCEGLIAAIIDQAGSAAVWSSLGLEMPHATLSLSTTFLSRTDADTLEFHSQVMGFGGGIGHTHVRVVDPERRSLIAHAMVNYVIGIYPGDSASSAVTHIGDPSRLGDQMITDLAGSDTHAALGLVDHAGHLAMAFSPSLVGSRGPVALHGGALAIGLIAASRLGLDDDQDPAGPPLSLSHVSIEYLRSGLQQASAFTAETVSRSRKTRSLSMRGTQSEGTRLMVSGTARYFAASAD